MRSFVLAIIVFAASSCVPMARDLPDESKLTAADKALESSFASAIDASEWLINTKHTIKGMPIERSSALLKILLDEGAIEVRLDQIVPDSKDPTFQSAGMLFIKLPRTEKGRKSVLQFISNMTGIERDDRGQNVVEISFSNETKQ